MTRIRVSNFLALCSFFGLNGIIYTAAVDDSLEYGVDVSWPMHYPWSSFEPEHTRFHQQYPNQENEPRSSILGDRKSIYDHFIAGCRKFYENYPEKKLCEYEEADRIIGNLEQPSFMRNFTDTGYKKVRAPEKLYSLIKTFWDENEANQYKESWGQGSVVANYWDSPSYMLSVENQDLVGGGDDLLGKVWDAAQDAVEEWVGMKVKPVSIYGIRIYKEGAILTPHCDRTPLVASVIINAAQDVDEDWPLEVIGHDGVARNITMEPGDMILYESHSVIHGRPFSLKGRYFANIFVHFEPYAEDECFPNESGAEDAEKLPVYASPDMPISLRDIYIEDVGAYDHEILVFPHDSEDEEYESEDEEYESKDEEFESEDEEFKDYHKE